MITINVCWLLFQDNVPDSTLKKLKKYMENPKFVPEIVEKTSKVYAPVLSCPAHTCTTALVRRRGNGRKGWVLMGCRMVDVDERTNGEWWRVVVPCKEGDGGL